jgi:hypothetical protein
MDEPTNDLDVETLELLEELLGEYPGTLLLVSHDRDFLDSVVTSTIVMPDGGGSGDGRIEEYVGGYSDWLRQRPRPGESARAATPPKADPATTSAPAPAPAATAATPKRKLSYKDQRELEALPQKIEDLETQVAAMTAAMAEPAFFSAITPRSPRTTPRCRRPRPSWNTPTRAGRRSNPNRVRLAVADDPHGRAAFRPRYRRGLIRRTSARNPARTARTVRASPPAARRGGRDR